MEPIFYNSLNLALESNYSKLTRLKNHYQTWQRAWENIQNSEKQSYNPEKEWQKLENLNIKLCLLGDLSFPPLLQEIPHPPFGLYLLGNDKIISQESIAIVGTRKASQTGKELAKHFSTSLAQADLNIISGLALGIDTKSHEGALEAKKNTVAVFGNGLDYIYPRINEKLAKKILDQSGLLVSEYPPGTPSLPYRFLERNRIISGLSRGILIIEAPENSGSLATARFALDQNREIFVVPGFINHPNFKGSNELIRQGATLVTKPEHILEVLKPEFLTTPKNPPTIFNITQEESKILNTFSSTHQTLNIDKIIELTKLDAQTVNQTLSFLVIKNLIKETENGYTL